MAERHTEQNPLIVGNTGKDKAIQAFEEVGPAPDKRANPCHVWECYLIVTAF
ncbi:MAG: hypothetical protein RMJ98_21015 [Myxococcales bacterium]|nr:hypothetical protein [Myxococcales bacterium]